MPKTQINTGYLPSTGTVEGFYTLFHSNTGVLNMDLLRKIYLKKKKRKSPVCLWDCSQSSAEGKYSQACTRLGNM